MMTKFRHLMFVSIFFSAIFIIWEPQSSAGPSYLHKRNSIYRLDDRYCGAYSAWHALRYFGIKKDINSIVDNVVSENGTTSIYELAEYLRSCGITTRPVKLDRAMLDNINQPFIPLFKSRNPVGHFVFCVPTKNGVVHDFDGPKRSSLDIEEMRSAIPDVWDGSCILLSESNNFSYPFVGVIALVIVILFFMITRSLYIKEKGGEDKVG